MQCKQDRLVSIGEAFGGLDGPVKALAKISPQARHHFTQADQVNQLVGASEADPDLGFMARLMALCSLPRTNPIPATGTSTSAPMARTRWSWWRELTTSSPSATFPAS